VCKILDSNSENHQLACLSTDAWQLCGRLIVSGVSEGTIHRTVPLTTPKTPVNQHDLMAQPNSIPSEYHNHTTQRQNLGLHRSFFLHAPCAVAVYT